MKPNQVFECENVIGIWNKREQAFVEGICVALSAVWCRNMLDGKRDLLSKPDYALAAPLQAKYEIIYKSDYTTFLNSVGLDVIETRTATGIPSMAYLMKNNGQYMLRYPGHAMAARISDSSYYFFDPEEGLFKLQSGTDFERHVMSRYSDHFGAQWTVRRVS